MKPYNPAAKWRQWATGRETEEIALLESEIMRMIKDRNALMFKINNRGQHRKQREREAALDAKHSTLDKDSPLA